MLNSFQNYLLNPNNKYIIWEIVKLYHPDIPETTTSKKGIISKTIDKIKIYPKYDWICIEYNYNGKIAIGLEFEVNLLGIGWKIEDFVKQYNNNKFKAWRFSDDSKYIPTDYSKEESERISNDPDINDLLISFNVPKPTPEEMIKYYYED
jgi:hypothetical protein